MTILDILRDFGFPVFAFLISIFACKYIYDTESAKSTTLISENMKRLEDLTLAVNNNTVVLTQLVEEIRKDEQDGN